MATHIITLEVDSSKLFDTLHALQQEVPEGRHTDPLGDRMASLMLAPDDFGVIEQVGLGVYGISVKSVERK